MGFTLRKQIGLLAIVAGLLPIAVVVAIIWNRQGELARQATAEMDKIVRMDVAQTARDLFLMCGMAHEHLRWQVTSGLRGADQILNALGAPTTNSETRPWQVAGGEPGRAGSVVLPVLLLGTTPVAATRGATVVDAVREMTGIHCSLFQRVNESGDMLRVATTILDDRQERAIGVLLPALRDGATNAIVSSLLAGETWEGPIRVGTVAHWAACRPIRQADGRVIGACAVSVGVQEAGGIRQAFLSTRIGQTGYAWALAGSGSDRGAYVISKDGRRDGENVWNAQYDGVCFVQSMVAQALSRPEGEIAFKRYAWKNPDDIDPRFKISAFTYFKPWDWVIGVGTYEDEFYAAKRNIERVRQSMLATVLGSGAVLLLIIVGLALSQGSRIVNPLQVAIGLAEKVAAGDLRGARRAPSRPAAPEGRSAAPGVSEGRQAAEVRQLLAVLRAMTERLASLVGQVQQAGIQVTASAAQIAASAHELEATVAEQAASTRQVKDTAREIATTSRDLESTMQEVSGTVSETASTAESGRETLGRMGDAMRQLTDATADIASKLGIISDKATRISRVVTTINRISEQTNLLSLNAAIEAEKAGEHGRGFAVVARETSRLADQTAVATQDIEQVVKEMQSSVSSGVMAMDKFADEVRRGVEQVSSVGTQLGAIIDQVRAMAPEFREVGTGMRNQAEGAQQISESMEQLAVAAEQTRASLGEFRGATEQLNEAVAGLRREVGRFRLDAEGA
jgi:methyl-accepting chemotaxis protein WspA